MKPSSRLITKLHAALFAGAIAAFAAVPAAQATVVYTNLTASPLTVPANIDGIYLNLVTGATGTSGSGTPGYDINLYSASAGLSVLEPAGAGAIVSPLAFGTTISSASTFVTGVNPLPLFRVTGQEYLGVKFLNESTGATDYGWLLLSTTATTGFPATILGYAYENAGGSITAGQISSVPEPGTLAMFSMALAGGLGLSAWRRRQG